MFNWDKFVIEVSPALRPSEKLIKAFRSPQNGGKFARRVENSSFGGLKSFRVVRGDDSRRRKGIKKIGEEHANKNMSRRTHE